MSRTGILLAGLALQMTIALSQAPAAVAAESVHLATYIRSGEHLLMHGTDYGATDSTVQVFFDDTNARRDEGAISLILNQELGKFLVLDHDKRQYQEVALPFDVVSMVPHRLQRDFEGLMPGRVLNGELHATEDTGAVGDWKAQRALAELSSGRGEKRDLSIWLSDDIEVESGAVFELFETISQLRIRNGGWWSSARQLSGFPVLIHEKYYTPVRSLPFEFAEFNEELQSIERVARDPGLFTPPDGYSKETIVLEVGTL